MHLKVKGPPVVESEVLYPQHWVREVQLELLIHDVPTVAEVTEVVKKDNSSTSGRSMTNCFISTSIL